MKDSAVFRVAAIILIVILMILAFNLASQAGSAGSGLDPKAVACAAGASGSGSEWSCVSNGRSLSIGHLPEGVTPYIYPVDEPKLLSLPKDNSIETLLPGAIDIRFFKGKDTMITTFNPPVTVDLYLTRDDQAALDKFNVTSNKKPYTLADVIPLVNFLTDARKWHRFPDGTVKKLSADQVDPKNGIAGFQLTIFDWGDPPIVPGVGRNGGG